MPTRKAKPSSADLEAEVGDYLLNRSTRERSEGREGTYKGKFMALLAEVGELVGEGHRVLLLNEPLTYHQYKGTKVNEKQISGIKRTRRVSVTLNSDKAMAFIKRKKLRGCTVMEEVINEDALVALAYQGDISDAEFQSLYDEKESFAFNLIESGKEADEQE